MPSPTPHIEDTTLAPLLGLARRAVVAAVRSRTKIDVRLEDGPAHWSEHGASFLTLRSDGGLRGCCGSIRAIRPLAEDVARNAWITALEDPRFAAVREGELPGLDLELSVLEPLQAREVPGRESLLELLAAERPGLVIAEGKRRATFLPKVWDSLPEAGDFLDALLDKGGFSRSRWPEQREVWTYGTATARGPLLED
ncbi:MAG: AmmeMemoRadiSam system protein A [Pseudomonadota bacterium]